MRSKIFALSLVLFGFMYGALSERLHLFPSYQLRPVFTALQKNLTKNELAVSGALVSDFRKTKTLESALLPLEIETFSLPLVADINLTGGAICSIANNVLLLDRLAFPFSFDTSQNRLTSLQWPRLENNFSEFLKTDRAGARKGFRVHGILCLRDESQTRLLVAHEFFDPIKKSTHLAISLLRISIDLESMDAKWTRIFTSLPLPGNAYAPIGGGGRMVQARENVIYLTIGDYNLDGVFAPETVAQDPESGFGQIIEIDLETKGVRQVSHGHRNPQGIALLKNGELLSTEQGPKGGDELNKISFGRNYGWPNVTYGTEYKSWSWTQKDQTGRHENFETPLFAWVPSAAVTQILQLSGFHQRWDNDLLIGSLKAGTLFRLRYQDGAVRYNEPIWIGSRIRDLVQTNDRRIVLWTDQGELIFISVDESALESGKRVEAFVTEPKGISCFVCHHLGPTNESHSAPSLSKILGKKIGSDNFAHYSSALRALDGDWNEKRLRQFLLNPNEFAPGSNMVIEDLSPSQVDTAIKFLKRLD